MESHNWGNKNKPKGLPGNFLVKLDQKEVWYSMLIPGKMDSESAHQSVAFTFQVSRGLKEKEGLNVFFGICPRLPLNKRWQFNVTHKELL